MSNVQQLSNKFSSDVSETFEKVGTLIKTFERFDKKKNPSILDVADLALKVLVAHSSIETTLNDGKQLIDELRRPKPVIQEIRLESLLFPNGIFNLYFSNLNNPLTQSFQRKRRRPTIS